MLTLIQPLWRAVLRASLRVTVRLWLVDHGAAEFWGGFRGAYSFLLLLILSRVQKPRFPFVWQVESYAIAHVV